jgi:small subunit ribosomal protein S16
MLAIRMQRTGRKGHAQYRLVAQDSRFSPTSGRVVAYLGSYNPHTKEAVIDGEKVSTYLANGAQPSDRAAKLLKKEGIKLPDWVKISPDKKREIRNPEKLRRNRPAGAEAEAEKPAEQEGSATETTEVENVEAPAETEQPAEDSSEKVEEKSEA